MPANIIKTVDLGGGGDFSSLAAFIAWLYNNYNPLDRNACAICRVSSGNTYGDSAVWGSLPTISSGVTILITTAKDHWFNGIFSSTRYYMAVNPTQPQYYYQLAFYRMQFGAPGQPLSWPIKAALISCGVISSLTSQPVISSDLVINSMIICTTNYQTAIQCLGSVPMPLIARNLILTRPGYTGGTGVLGANDSERIHGNLFVRFTVPTNYVGGATYYNSTTSSSINPDTYGNIKNATPTFVDEDNWNYILSVNDTSAKYLYPGYDYGGLPVSLYHNGITGYRFPNASIGPTDPDPGSYPPWVTKVVNTDGQGDFTSLNAALAWLYSNYPNLVTSNIRAKIICKGTATDSTNVTTTISTTDPVHYIHIIAHDDYRFRGVPNLTQLYKRSAIAIGDTFHIILEGIQINQGSSSLSKSFLVIGCHVSTDTNLFYGNYINSILILSTTNTISAFLNSLLNCTVINTNSTSGVIPAAGTSVNCIVIGAVQNIAGIASVTLGTVSNYASGPISMYCKYGQTVAFKNPSSGDYRLSWSDTAAKWQGIYAGSYLEDVVDLERQKRPIKSSYGADEPCLEYVEVFYGADPVRRIKFLIDYLIGAERLGVKSLLERLYCVAEDLYRGALSGRILIRVQKKIARIYRI